MEAFEAGSLHPLHRFPMGQLHLEHHSRLCDTPATRVSSVEASNADRTEVLSAIVLFIGLSVSSSLCSDIQKPFLNNYFYRASIASTLRAAKTKTVDIKKISGAGCHYAYFVES